MNILDIAKIPTVRNNVHESLYRSYHALDKVKELLEAGTPGHVILEIIATIEDAVPGRQPTPDSEKGAR